MSRKKESPEEQGAPTGAIRAPAPLGGPVLAFEVAGQQYGLPVEKVVQIVEMVALTTLPAAPEIVVGVIDFHGRVIPAIDMRLRFRRPAQPYTLRTPIIVSQLDGRSAGLIVDSVRGLIEIQGEQVESAPEIVTEEMIPQTPYLTGVARLANGLLLLLDAASLLSQEEEKAIQKASARRKRAAKKGNQ